MLDQAFTAGNFRRIFDLENRKGLYLEARFFPEVKKLTEKIAGANNDIRQVIQNKGNLSTSKVETTLQKLNHKKDDLAEKKEDLLTSILEGLSKEIADNEFEIKLNELNGPGGKQVYAITDDPKTFFIEKQVQSNLNKTFSIKQGHRYNIISQLRYILDGNFPKIVIRTDIESFYESIDQTILGRFLRRNSLFSEPSKKVIRSILNSYNDATKKTTGLPRGVGVSAYLAELYMRGFDKSLRSMEDVIFYARYVDDIVIIIVPNPVSSSKCYIDHIEKQAAKLSLKLNVGKTEKVDVTDGVEKQIDYLGYRINFGAKKSKLVITPSKTKKYKDRIALAFKAYEKKKKLNEKMARKLLVKRLRFLTGNTRLLNRKRNALVGIYYGNANVTNPKCFVGLDKFLKAKISTLDSVPLQNRLRKMSFVDGFVEKRFASFTAEELDSIVSIWKYVQ